MMGVFMTVGLTAEQRQAIEECGGEPLYLVDAATNAGYVLMWGRALREAQDSSG